MGKKVLILSNHFITLYNFRKELIAELIAEGHEVYISLPKADENRFFNEMGCTIIETLVDRRGINPIFDLMLVLKYIKIMNLLKPDIIFSFTIKPNIYGCIASNITKYRQISNITGTGATFLKENFVSKVVKLLYKSSVKRSYKVFFQNNGDQDFFISNKMLGGNYALIPGSGVNLEQFSVYEWPNSDNVNFIFIGRVMDVKGIYQFLECAKYIKKKHPETTFYVAGFIEEEHYKPIIEDFHKKEIITYLGFQKDIKQWIKKCHCTILPSLGGEGVPNVLLESAAMGRVCIASNINGSRDIIDDKGTGYLFETGRSNDLINKVEMFLALTRPEQKEMGLKARKKVELEFDRRIIIDIYLNELTRL